MLRYITHALHPDQHNTLDPLFKCSHQCTPEYILCIMIQRSVSV